MSLPSSSEEAALKSPASSLSLLRSLTSSSSSFNRRSSLALSIFVVFEDLELAGRVFVVAVCGAAGSSSPSDADLVDTNVVDTKVVDTNVADTIVGC